MKFIENSNEGVHCYNRFSADFSDDMDCYERAQTNFDYAAEQYEKDMELTAIDEYVMPTE